MTLLSKNPTSNSVVVTGWTNPTYAYNEDGTQLATAAPGKAAYITSDYRGFDFSGIPDGATINTFTVLVQAKASTGALLVLHLLYQPWSGGSAIGVEKDQNQLTTSLTPYSQTWTLTAAQIKSADFGIRLRAYRTGNTGYTLSVDYIRVTVDYTAPVPNHALTANALNVGTPELLLPAVGQNHTLGGMVVNTASPTLSLPGLTQNHIVTATGIGTGVPTLAAPILTEQSPITNYEIAGTGISAGVPTLANPGITQNHSLSANLLSSTTPSLGTPSLETQALNYVLGGTAISVGVPVLGAPATAQNHALAANGLTSGQPALTLGQMVILYALFGGALAAGTPSLGSPSFNAGGGRNKAEYNGLDIGHKRGQDKGMVVYERY